MTTRDPIVSVREPGQLRARVFVPSRSDGFLRVGLGVRLLYDAFPHQRFGSFPGTVTALSSHASAPSDLGELSLREPVFEATVALASDTVSAYGETIPLRSGMGLRADIVLERRSLMEWLLEPLFANRGRS